MNCPTALEFRCGGGVIVRMGGWSGEGGAGDVAVAWV